MDDAIHIYVQQQESIIYNWHIPFNAAAHIVCYTNHLAPIFLTFSRLIYIGLHGEPESCMI